MSNLPDRNLQADYVHGAKQMYLCTQMDYTFHITASQPESQQYISKREYECLVYMKKGMTSKQIARVLKLSYRTIEFYIARMKTRFNCHTKVELLQAVGHLHTQE